MKILFCSLLRKRPTKGGLTFCGVVLSLIFLVSIPAHATLIDNGDGTITDTSTNLMWMQNTNLAATNTFGVSGILDGRMNWFTAESWISAMNASDYLGYNDWQLPTLLQPDSNCDFQTDPGGGAPIQGFGYNCTGSDLGRLYYTSLGNSAGGPLINSNNFTNVTYDLTNVGRTYWYGSLYPYNIPNNDFGPRAWSFDFNDGTQLFALGAVGDLTNAWALREVPEPGTLVLMGVGLMGLIAARKRLSWRLW